MRPGVAGTPRCFDVIAHPFGRVEVVRPPPARRLAVWRGAVEIKSAVRERVGAEARRLLVRVDDVLVHEELTILDRAKLRWQQPGERVRVLRDPPEVEHSAVDHHLRGDEHWLGHGCSCSVRGGTGQPPASFTLYRSRQVVGDALTVVALDLHRAVLDRPAAAAQALEGLRLVLDVGGRKPGDEGHGLAAATGLGAADANDAVAGRTGGGRCDGRVTHATGIGGVDDTGPRWLLHPRHRCSLP